MADSARRGFWNTNEQSVHRSQLSRLGFGTAAPGVWIAPAYLHEATK